MRQDKTRQDEAAKMDVKVWYLHAATSSPTRLRINYANVYQ